MLDEPERRWVSAMAAKAIASAWRIFSEQLINYMTGHILWVKFRCIHGAILCVRLNDFIYIFDDVQHRTCFASNRWSIWISYAFCGDRTDIAHPWRDQYTVFFIWCVLSHQNIIIIGFNATQSHNDDGHGTQSDKAPHSYTCFPILASPMRRPFAEHVVQTACGGKR